MSPEEFHKIRKAAGLTQSQMAARLGVTRLTICNWEGAKFRIPDDVLDRLAEKGIGVESPKPNKANSKLVADTIKYYREMRADFTHEQILRCWFKAGFTPAPEAQAAIVAEFPDILEAARPTVLETVKG